jgi:serine/threonine protein kinase
MPKLGLTRDLQMILDKPYGHEVDWWSFGVLIYQLVARKTPFRGKNEDEIYDAILMGKPVFSPLITIQTSSIISQLLEVEPTLRLGSGPGDAEDVMQHNWFEAIDWHELYRKRVPPPLFPTVSSAADTRNFDAEFTTQDVAATPDTTGRWNHVLTSNVASKIC